MSNFFRENKKPLFMPDATYGNVKAVSWNDLEQVGTKAIVTNTLHLFINLGDEYINSFGGFKNFSNYRGGLVTDSGGFQAYSLIKKGLGEMHNDHILFKSPKNGNTYLLSPTKSIQIQLNLRSDVIVVLDDCVHPSSPKFRIQDSVQKTTSWAKICKEYFLQELAIIKEKTPDYDPLIFCVIQGGNDFKLREQSFNELSEIGFDGYGFGGWPTDDKGNFLSELLEFNSNLVKKTRKYNYAMGVGYPNDIIKCLTWGYNLFDCVLPTRNARHGLIYKLYGNEVKEIKINNAQYYNSNEILNENSNVKELQETSFSFLQSLFKVEDPNAYRIATINNLEVYNKIIEKWSSN